jgi:hypothetical protein
LAVPPGTAPAVSATAPLFVWVGTKLEALGLTVVEFQLEELVVWGAEVVVAGGGWEVVVGDGSQVVTGIYTLVGGGGGGGGGGGEGEGDGEGEEPPELKFHVPVRTPSEISPKNSKRPCEKSRPVSGQPGHFCCGNI